jgi:tetratricopeptide (TPR) repeat protein
LAQAEKEIRTAMRLEPDKTGTIHPRSRDLHLVLGELLARRGDIDGAELEFAKGMSGPSDEDEVTATERPPSDSHEGASLYSKGVRDGKSGHVDQGIGEMSKGLEMMRKDPVPDYGPLAMRYIPLAELYDSIGNHERVEAILKEVNSMPEGELAAGLARARIKLNHSDKEGAERILRDLSDRYPGNAQVLIALGDVQADLKENEQALVSYQGAIPNAIGKVSLHSSMARALHAMGRDREALDQCRLAQALGPRDWASQFSCAEIRNAVQSKSN